jgi:hypothetical protein
LRGARRFKALQKAGKLGKKKEPKAEAAGAKAKPKKGDDDYDRFDRAVKPEVKQGRSNKTKPKFDQV